MAGQHLAAVSSGHGPRIVLVHGFTQTSVSWDGIRGDLSADHEVVAVDAPGHGHSAEIQADLWRSADLIGDVGAVATYVGYSMGGRMVLHLALERPDLVQRLVLIGAHAGMDDDLAREERRDADEELARLLERQGVAAFLDRWLSQELFATLPPERAGRDDRLRNTPAGLASSLRLAGTGRQEPLWPLLHRLTMPVLIVVGEHDPKFRAIGLRLTEAIGDNASLAVVPGAGHAVHLERPHDFVALLRGWLAR